MNGKAGRTGRDPGRAAEPRRAADPDRAGSGRAADPRPEWRSGLGTADGCRGGLATIARRLDRGTTAGIAAMPDRGDAGSWDHRDRGIVAARRKRCRRGPGRAIRGLRQRCGIRATAA